jgi:hypothetical protein
LCDAKWFASVRYLTLAAKATPCQDSPCSPRVPHAEPRRPHLTHRNPPPVWLRAPVRPPSWQRCRADFVPGCVARVRGAGRRCTETDAGVAALRQTRPRARPPATLTPRAAHREASRRRGKPVTRTAPRRLCPFNRAWRGERDTRAAAIASIVPMTAPCAVNGTGVWLRGDHGSVTAPAVHRPARGYFRNRATTAGNP